MDSIKEIERATDTLTAKQIDELYQRLDQRHPLLIDPQLKTDLDAACLDGRIDRVLADHKAGKTQLL